MDKSSIISQMEAVVRSLIGVNETLKALSNSNEVTVREELYKSKQDLIDTIILLNECYNSMLQRDFLPGSLILVPRYYEGVICFDFAIIRLIKNNCLDTDQFINQQTQKNILSSTSSDKFSNDTEQIITVHWLRPHSLYELYSDGINFSKTQILGDAISLFKDQEKSLENIIVGDYVLFLNVDKNVNNGEGIWRKGIY
jgi:hypothetical protein